MSQTTLDRPRFSVIVPIRNEQDAIAATLDSFARVFEDSEVIAVLNGCTDGTKDLVEHLSQCRPQIKVVDIPEAVGKGGAVRAGFLLARAEIVGYVDADGSTPAPEMRRLCEAIGDNDGVVASRWLAESNVVTKRPLMRRFASRSCNLLVRALFGLGFSDTQCGAKVFRKEALERVMLDVETANRAFDVDLLFQLKRNGMRVVEVPTYWLDPYGPRIALASTMWSMLGALTRLRIRHSFLRLIVPFFDRLFPTHPVRLQNRLRILMLNWRDVKHPLAGGAETYSFEQAKRWVQWGHHVEWIAAGYEGCSKTDEIDGIRVRRVGNAFTVYFLLPFVYLLEYRDRFDVVLDTENGIPLFSPLFSLRPKICILHHIHRETFRKYLPALVAYPLMWVEEKLMPFLYRNSHFVTVSDDTRKEMEELHYSRRTIGLVRNGVDKDLGPGPKSPVPMVLYFGRLKEYKRVDLLIDAFSRLKAEMPSAVLVIAGAGDTRAALEEQTRRLGLEDCVTFEGFVDERRKRELLQQAWVSVSPSEMEGWGIGIIESNACGTPAVAFSVPGLREAIVHNHNGLLVPEGGNLTPAILSVLCDESLRERLARGAHERALAFSWDNAAREMLVQIVRAIVGGEFHIVDVGEQWAFVGSRRDGFPHVISSRATLEAYKEPLPPGDRISVGTAAN